MCLHIADIGDYDPDLFPAGYVSDHKMLPKQCDGHEETIVELHKTLTCVITKVFKCSCSSASV